jgi:hypothetical protein
LEGSRRCKDLAPTGRTFDFDPTANGRDARDDRRIGRAKGMSDRKGRACRRLRAMQPRRRGVARQRAREPFGGADEKGTAADGHYDMPRAFAGIQNARTFRQFKRDRLIADDKQRVVVV